MDWQQFKHLPSPYGEPERLNMVSPFFARCKECGETTAIPHKYVFSYLERIGYKAVLKEED